MSAPRASPQNRQPTPMLVCICSLCNCGGHSCQTFGPTASGHADNRCAEASMTEPATECQCLDDERYLGPREPELPSAGQSEPELLRVLVTRPAVAAKPRDNIAFRGDMDLKTTFETSYEALAKMRLDGWRKYQQRRADWTGNISPPSGGQLRAKRQSEVSFREPSEQAAGSHLERSQNEAGRARRSAEPPGDQELAQLVRDTKQPAKGTRIDSNLSPMIVYDANMNRLETVGIRRRSKYRPSTSLRSGARGLFGDQEEPEAPVGLRHKRSAREQVHERVKSPLEDKPAGDYRHSPELSAVKSERAMDKRNLRHSSQANNLTFSEHNILVDSKRRVAGNINMTDHIQEQTIDAQLEEAAAVEEIRRCTEIEGLDREAAADGQTPGGQERASADLARLDSTPADDRDQQQSRLARTCQHQNFDIFQNEYPEVRRGRLAQADASHTSAASTTTAKPLSPQQSSRVYNNLFMESPDFIMTTGKLHQQTEASQQQQERQEQPDQQQTRSHTRVARHADADRDILAEPANDEQAGQQCKVLNLDQEFQFVESHFGHKYFIEKDSFNLDGEHRIDQ